MAAARQLSLGMKGKGWSRVVQDPSEGKQEVAFEPVYADVAVRRRIATVLLLGVFLTAVGSVTASILLKRRDAEGEVEAYNQATADFFRSEVDSSQIQRHQATVADLRRQGVNETARLQKKLTGWGIATEITMHTVAVTTYASRSLELSLQDQSPPKQVSARSLRAMALTFALFAPLA